MNCTANQLLGVQKPDTLILHVQLNYMTDKQHSTIYNFPSGHNARTEQSPFTPCRKSHLINAHNLLFNYI